MESRRQLQVGELIKRNFSMVLFQEDIEAIVRTANDYEMTTAAHAHGAEGMKRAVLAGITSIEHGTKMTEEVMDLMVERGTYYVPTISAGETVMKLAQKPGYFPAIIIPKAMMN